MDTPSDGSPAPPHPVHRYVADLAWSGSTAVGYEGYGRGHAVTTPPAEGALAVSADPAFRGDAARTNPEQLLLAAAASCQLLSFLAVAARARVDVVAYHDRAEAVMPEDDPPTRITRIVLAPSITIRAGAGADASVLRAKVERLVRLAHDECYIANSLRSEIVVESTIHIEHAIEQDDPVDPSEGHRG